jgi:hypothetical protein
LIVLSRILRAGVVLIGLANIAFALWVMVDHRGAAETLGYGLNTSLAASEFIVAYVGLVGAFGVQLVLAPFVRDGRAWLRLGALLFAGLVFGRLVGFFSVEVDPDRRLFGLDGASVMGALFEAAAGAVCWFAARIPSSGPATES